jgi:rhodanese-related sulfurtransferase
VEELAELTGMEVGNTSAHLQVLRGARLVEIRKDGTRVYYRLAGDEVTRLLVTLQEVARTRLAEVGDVVRTHLSDPDGLEAVGREELLERVGRGEIIVLDVRPVEEFRAGHIPEAISIPVDELEARLGELPDGIEVVAYCRGPYCVFARDAVQLLRRRGHHARRLVDGLPEWRLAGLPVAVGRN